MDSSFSFAVFSVIIRYNQTVMKFKYHDVTNYSAANAAPVILKHSKSADLLRKSLLSNVWRVPSSKVLSCKHERLFDLLTLTSFYK